MITRRRGRMLQVSEEQPVEVEVCDSQMSPTETFTGEDLDATTIELDELFREFKWTVDRDPTSPLFDMDLEEFRMYGTEQDSGREVSSASSPERRETDLKMRKSNQSHGLNKNAIAARLNRIKKKEYVSNLERKVTGLSSENSTLKRENSELMKRVEELEDETRQPPTTPATTTTRCRRKGCVWRRGVRRQAGCAYTWTGIMCLWNSAPSVQRAPARHSKFSSRFWLMGAAR
ncbi:uncharacterized protein crebzf isoform X2 [Periophthalmus magnuspinnatus]|uniref:uncharacterized protein crebzf isoform X2 n=1 Tax=Periophthalmus magnuspinnatus TaxID=409849 RepID=UPI002436DBA4|nr:uncharacterized protein crebzf isoform X2 [Periophthalmus magnuspinnatus]